VVVVGAGAAGIAAAVASARAGSKTLLLDQRAGPGGTGGFSGLTTLCGLYDSAGEFLVSGVAREFAEQVGAGPRIRMGRVWVLPYRPERFREFAAESLAAEPTVQTCWNTAVSRVEAKGGRISSVNGIETTAVIDCSGSAEVARALEIKCLETDEATQSPAIIFPLHGVQADLKSAAAVARVLLPLVRAGLPPLSFQPGSEPGVLSVKFTGHPEQVPEVLAFLRSHVVGFEQCATPLTEFVPARRAGRMIVGQYMLTGKDVLSARKFEDAAARCSWPIEQWGTDGVARLRYLAEDSHYEIPARALRAATLHNLFMAGKTISADVDAIASARVMGCCLATGAAAGQLAAAWVDSAS
jgi:hypothetical protein